MRWRRIGQPRVNDDIPMSGGVRHSIASRLKKFFAWGDVIFFFAFAGFVAYRATWTWRTWVGVAFIAIGFALWLTARLQLGSSFTPRAEARRLVTTGLYAHFRHPIYLFGFVAYSGVFLIWGSWIAFLIFVLVYTVEIFRLRKEERVLEEAFAEEYHRYRARTW